MVRNKERQTDLDLNWDSFKYRNYDYAIGRFMSIDPLAEKYPYNSTYAFSENRVINAREIEGLEARVIVEKGNYFKLNPGHTFVAVGSNSNLTVYTYGRYGELAKDKGSSNTTNLKGEGVLIKLQGKKARNFINHYVNDLGASVYELKNVDDKKVKKTFETEFNSSNKHPKIGRYANSENAKVKDTYNLLKNNCTTKSIKALEKGNGGPITYTTEIKDLKFYGTTPIYLSYGKQTNIINAISPADLKNQLDKASKDPNSGIINVTKDFKGNEDQ